MGTLDSEPCRFLVFGPWTLNPTPQCFERPGGYIMEERDEETVAGPVRLLHIILRYWGYRARAARVSQSGSGIRSTVGQKL